MNWPPIKKLTTERLTLEPLTLVHAKEMVGVLAAPELYTFTGDAPLSLEELQKRYTIQIRGHSADESQGWFNWIIRQRHTSQAVGYVQATLSRSEAGRIADIAWVVGPQFQGNGIATEAAKKMIEWLVSQGTPIFRASINPTNVSSTKVAERLGMRETEEVIEDECVWMLTVHWNFPEQ